MDGFVIDAYPDAHRPKEMVLWIKRASDGRAVPLRETFTPRFYVRPRAADAQAELERLAGTLPLLPGVESVAVEDRLVGLDARPSPVLAVAVEGHDRVAPIAEAVDAIGEHRDLDLFDVDLRASSRFLAARGLFPFARVRAWKAGRYRLLDEQWANDYERAPLTMVELDASVDAKGPVPTPEDRLVRARVGKTIIESSDEERLLCDLAQAVRAQDPDILLTDGGDAFLMPYLEERARRAGLAAWTLGRDGGGARRGTRGKSFFTYGKIKYRAPSHPLAGRIHLDRKASFFFNEGGFAGLIDLSRVSGIPLQEVARLEAGTLVTAIQIDCAKREGRLIPWKKNVPEAPKTLRQLAKADRGGFIFDPVVGVHEDVFELDFSSLYPSIMATRNISPETVLCDCCDPHDDTHPLDLFVPQIGYHVCRQRHGLVPRAVGQLVRRRTLLKDARKQHPERRAELQARVDALKWLCVVSFGYQGYRNARFGRIECHESTCAWAREIILTASEIARAEGFEILHGIVDSLWVKRTRPGASAEALAAAVEREVGIRFEPQGRYKWIVFLPTRGHTAPGVDPIGALNRYYGCFDTIPDAPSRSQAGQDVDYLAGGALKVRGVELRQSSACAFVVRAQEAALNALAPAEDAVGFHARIPHALAAVRPLFEQLRAGRVRVEDLLVTTRVSQTVEEYRQRNDAWAALSQLAKRGITVNAGERVRYVVLREGERRAEARVREARLLDGSETYDKGFYERLTLRALESLLMPVGLRESELRAALAPVGPRAWQGVQTRLPLA